MRTKYVGIIIVGLLVVVGGYFLLRGGYQAPASAPDPTSAPTVAQRNRETNRRPYFINNVFAISRIYGNSDKQNRKKS